jgi:alpha-L-fucosidase
VLELTLPEPRPVSILEAREDITRGQVVSQYIIEGANGESWTTLARGTTIGYRRLHRVSPVTVSRLRLTIEDAVGPVVEPGLLAWRG